MIEVNANYFRAAAECQSTEETRYYLNGVYVAPHPDQGVVLTATDGHRLISIHDKHGKCSAAKIVKVDPKAIDAKAMSGLRRAMMSDAPQVLEDPKLYVDEAGIVTIGTYRSLKSCFIDGTFPDWVRVVLPVLAAAKKAEYSPASCNQEYVASFGKIAVMLSPSGSDRGRSIRIISFTEHDPSLVRFGGIDHAFGILMPMRSAIPNELPIWMKPILEPEKPESTSSAPGVPSAESSKGEKKVRAKKPVSRRSVKKGKAVRSAKKATKRRAA